MLSNRIKIMGWALMIAVACVPNTPARAASLSPTGVLPDGSFVNDFSVDGVIEFEVLWETIDPIQLTIQFSGNAPKLALRIANTNNTGIAWSDFHLQLDDGPIWNGNDIFDVSVIPSATGMSYEVTPMIDPNANNNADLLFDPNALIQPTTNMNDPNGQLFVGNYNSIGLIDWTIDVDPLITDNKHEFLLTLFPTVPDVIIPTPSAAWAGLLGFSAIWSVSRRRKA